MKKYISCHGFIYRGYWIKHYIRRGYLGPKHLFHTFGIENHPYTKNGGHGNFPTEAKAKSYIDTFIKLGNKIRL